MKVATLEQNYVPSVRRLMIRLKASVRRGSESHESMRVRQIELLSTVEAHPVSPLFDGEDAAEVTVPAAEDKLENCQ
jgi:hypothetical protein